MDKVVCFERSMDEEEVVAEIHVLVDCYLESIEMLQEETSFEKMPILVYNIGAYWQRLNVLYVFMQTFNTEVDDLTCHLHHVLQQELGVLEKVYFSIESRIYLDSNLWTEAMWKAAEIILKRIDQILELFKFEIDHVDRLVIAELNAKNTIKRHQTFLKKVQNQLQKSMLLKRSA